MTRGKSLPVWLAQLEEEPAIIVQADTEKKIEIELTCELDAYIDTFSKPENIMLTGGSHGHDRLVKEEEKTERPLS